MQDALYDTGDLDWILPTVRDVVGAFFPTTCTQQRLGGGGTSTIQSDLPCRVVPDSRQVYPFAAIPDQAVQRWQVQLPAGTDVQPNDLLTTADGRVYVALYPTAPGAYDTRRVAVSVLSALPGQALASAYLRPNATVSSTRNGFPVYTERRVHVAYAQANPSQPLERIIGGVATLRVALFALADDDFQQGDGVQVLVQDGPTVLPGITAFTLAGVLRRPLPFAICEMDGVADV